MSAARPSAPDPARLNGWKDIATHVGKGVRTVQRWEKLYGLPVHRLGEEGGEIVFAFRGEVDAWLRTKSRARGGLAALESEADHGPNGATPVPPPVLPVAGLSDAPQTRSATATIAPPAAAPRRRVLGLSAAVVLLIVTAASVWLLGLRAHHPPAIPASWKVEQDTLKVFDASGGQLWAYRFEGQVLEDYYRLPSSWSAGAAIDDLDGDGVPEVVVMAAGAERAHSQVLRCFNADGTLRWQRRLDDRVRFGENDYEGPWTTRHFKALPNGDGTKSVWAVFIHGMWFPTVLERIDHDGTIRSRYWSNGYVETLSESTWQGRRVLLVGTCNNELKGSSLAILDPDDAAATAPAANPAYQCTTCPAREPIEFLVFPGSAIRRALNEPGNVETAWATAEGGLVVQVMEHHHDAPFGHGAIYYTLDASLRPVKVEISNRYIDLHNWFHKAGRVDRPYTPDEWTRLVPILRWQDGRYVEMAPPTP